MTIEDIDKEEFLKILNKYNGQNDCGENRQKKLATGDFEVEDPLNSSPHNKSTVTIKTIIFSALLLWFIIWLFGLSV